MGIFLGFSGSSQKKQRYLISIHNRCEKGNVDEVLPRLFVTWHVFSAQNCKGEPAEMEEECSQASQRIASVISNHFHAIPKRNNGAQSDFSTC